MNNILISLNYLNLFIMNYKMAQALGIIIVDKNGTLKVLNVKDYKEDELYKKCGFKKADGFSKQIDWTPKIDGQRYVISVYAKTDGKANCENKYDFPPPIDSKLFFGSCALVAHLKKEDGSATLTNLSIALWDKIYEKLFGGFEDLAATCVEDEDEEDELANVPAEKKTKDGYLKDGFVVDSDGEEDDDDYETEDENEEDDSEEVSDSAGNDGDELLLVEDIGSELSEEDYDYESDGDEN
jgi:hypothetical protein